MCIPRLIFYSAFQNKKLILLVVELMQFKNK